MKTKLEYRKSTKGTHVFGSDNKDAIIPSLYVKKHAFKSKIPKVIEVTIKVIE